jgi:hypothetical protein
MPNVRCHAERLQLHALAYNLGNLLRTLATPELIKDWSLTSLKEKPIKIGTKIISHGRSVVFPMAEVAISPSNVPGDFAPDWSCDRNRRQRQSWIQTLRARERQSRLGFTSH